MKAQLLDRPGFPLRLAEFRIPEPGPGEILIEVHACGVCRTDLHIADGELAAPHYPIIPGHEIVGRVVKGGSRFSTGGRVGVPWLGKTCGTCRFCLGGRENLCDSPLFTGHGIHGGYAEYVVAYEDYCLPIPESYGDAEAAPLLCAGLIGHRALKAAGDAHKIGIYGFGAAAHIATQVATHEGREIYAFTRAGDSEAQDFARSLGAGWAGSSGEAPPEELDAAIIFAPAGELVPEALSRISKGGTVVCGGIHMSDIPRFPYSILWGERSIRSIANLTRKDGEEFMEIAPLAGVKTEVTTFPLEFANLALDRLRSGRIRGAAVLVTAACS